jgi:Holliday junction DNA helicase RuvA
MIDIISGTIKKVYEKSITVFVNGLGLHCHTPRPHSLKENNKVELFSYLHWNTEKGPSLYAFCNELERTTFLMIIDCPKIGPGIALNILSQIEAPHFLEIITSQNEAALSAINGIGAKKAEQLVMQLKHKVAKLIASGTVQADAQQDFVQWQNINDVLQSLNYSKQEISGAIKHLGKEYGDQNYPLDKLIRAALSFLSQSK